MRPRIGSNWLVLIAYLGPYLNTKLVINRYIITTMTPISKDDYLKLLEDLSNDQYGSDDYSDEQHIPDEAWIPSESGVKEMIRFKNLHGKIDVTKYRKEQI